jgi:glycosyltransferase involved in cell wall biosynthesis
MSRPIAVTTMVFTLNEEIHLPACLDSLTWCDDVVVVDSFSTDHSLDICRQRGARVFQRRFDGFGTQRNWALENAEPRHPWILILDADERVPPDLVRELAGRLPGVPADVGAFRVARRFYFWGRWLRYSSLYPTYVVRLCRAGRVRYLNRGHAETQEVDGAVWRLEADLIDENRKGLAEWFSRQNRYSGSEAEYELAQERLPWRLADLASADPLARRAALKRLAASMPGRPAWYFLYSYIVRGGFLDGVPGFIFCLLKSVYQWMIAIKKIESRLGRGNAPVPGEHA